MCESRNKLTIKRDKLTIKQKMVLECIEWFINKNGYSPTYREIAELINSDVCSVSRKIFILLNKGYISQVNGKQRTLRVIKSVECE